jgi:molecular chaperone GrpE
MSEQEKDKVAESDIVTKEQPELEVQEPPVSVGGEATTNSETAFLEAEIVEETVSLEEQLEQARQEAARNLENWQRAVAEIANFKRRQEEQAKLQRDRIKAEVLEGVISALDDMDLAFQNLPEELNGQLVGWVEGFRLVQRKLDKILDDQYVGVIPTEGKFDPNYHQAVSVEESEAHAEGDIIGEVRKGYQIGNRVIRPALVRVAK